MTQQSEEHTTREQIEAVVSPIMKDLEVTLLKRIDAALDQAFENGATAMRDKCVEALGQQRNRMLNLYQQIFTMKSTGDPQHPLQACIDYDAKVAFEEALESLTLDQVKPGEM